MKNRIIGFLLMLVLCLALLPLAVPTAGAAMAASGKCGDNVSWTLSDSGKLSITGNGDMYDYNYDTPWYDRRHEIKSVVIGAKTATLTVTPAASMNGYQYRCVITDANGNKTYSSAATLTVK